MLAYIANIGKSDKIGCFEGTFLTILLNALKEHNISLLDCSQLQKGKRVETTLVTNLGTFKALHGEYSCSVCNLMKPILKYINKI